MRAERWDRTHQATVAGIPFLSRLKSIRRSLRLVAAAAMPHSSVAAVATSALRCLVRPAAIAVPVVMSSLTRVSVAQRLRSRSYSDCIKSALKLLLFPAAVCARHGPTARRLKVLRVLRHLLAGFKTHVMPSSIGTIPANFSPAAFFFPDRWRCGRRAPHFENRPAPLPDLGLRSQLAPLEDQRVLVFLDGQAFFRDHGTANDLIWISSGDLRRFLTRPTSRSSGGLLTASSGVSFCLRWRFESSLQSKPVGSMAVRKNSAIITQQMYGWTRCCDPFDSMQVARA